MRSRIAGFFALLSCAALLAGCALDEPLGSRDAAFRANPGSTGAPSGVSATATSHFEILIKWTDNSANETGFELHYSWTGANGEFQHFSTVSPNVTSWPHSGLSPSSEYCYRIRTLVVKGRKTTYSPFSNVACATTRPLPLPNAPTDVTVQPIKSSAVNLTWTAPADGQRGFRIERAGSPAGPWTILMTATTTIRSWQDGGLSGDMPVCYRVSAFNDYGFSPPSAVACSATMLAPTNLTATAIAPNVVELGWSDNSAVEAGYEVRRAGSNGAWTVVATLPANAVGHQDSGVNADARYVYAVFARRDGGHSNSSNEVAVTTASAGTPTAPVHMDVVPVSSSSVAVEWSASSPDADSYRIERSTNGMVTWSTVATVAAGVMQLEDTEQQPEVEGCYRAIAVNGTTLRESVPSIVDCTTPPAAPTNLVFDGPYSDWYSTWWYVSWTDNSNVEDGYLLWMTYWDCNVYDDAGYCINYYQAYYPLSLPANTTNWTMWDGEMVYGLVATKDGGQSSWLFPPVETSARMTANRAEQLQKRGAKKGPPRPGVTPTRVKPDQVRSANSGSRR